MAYVSPPANILAGVDRFAPGFWNSFSRAIGNAYRESGGGWNVTSWWRSTAHNEDVGGARESQHLIGTAFDVWAPDLGRLALALQRQGFRTLRYSGHVHAQAWPPGAARSSGLLGYLGL